MRVASVLALACVLSAPSFALSGPIEAQSVQVDGSGTSNPALLVWRLLEMIMAKTKPAVFMTYRSIGSSAGQSDFDITRPTSRNSFAMGDFPLTAAQYQQGQQSGNPPLQIPLMVGSVSVFHAVPGTGSSGLRLSPCTLAGIFQGIITRWNDAAIAAENPSVDLPSNNIFVIRRTDGSSSTYALASYLTQAAPQCWSGGSSATVTTWAVANVAVPNSQTMVTRLAAEEYSIGYVESSAGLAAGLSEVSVQNAAGTYLGTQDPGTIIVSPELISERLPTNAQGEVDPTTDWSNTTFIYAGGANTWPLTLLTFLFIRTDLSWQGQAGGLVLRLVEDLLSSDTAELMPTYGFVPLSSNTRNLLNATVFGEVTLNATAIPWRREVTTDRSFGWEDYVISNQRQSHTVRTLDGLTSDMGNVQAAMKQGSTYQVHGGGSFLAAAFFRRIMTLLDDRSRAPLTATYRVVGSIEAQEEFVDFPNSVANLNNFKVGDVPLPTTLYDTFISTYSTTEGGSSGGVMHIPIGVSSISIFVNQQVPLYSLALSPCTAAKIFTGQVTRWNAADVIGPPNNYDAANPFLAFPIVVYGYSTASSNTQILSTWLSKACAASWGSLGVFISAPAASTWASTVTTTFQGSPIVTPSDMAAAIQGTPHSIGYLPTQLGHSFGLDEARLVNLAGQAVTPSTTSLTQTIQTFISARSVPLPSANADWGSIDPVGQDGATSWPMPALVYAYSYRNLSAFNLTGPLTKALFEFVLSSEGQTIMTTMGIAPLPASLLLTVRNSLDSFILGAGLTEWSFESDGGVGSAGMSLFSFSSSRASSTQMELEDLQTTLDAVTANLTTNLPVLVRLVGITAGDSGPLVRRMLDDLTDFSSAPIKYIYEEFQSTTAPQIHQQLLTTVPSKPVMTHFMVLDQPLTNAQWTELGQSPGLQVLQAPWLIRPLALVYKAMRVGDPQLRIPPCTLARIMTSQITQWNDNELKAANPSLSLPSKPITLVMAGEANSGNMRALRAYVTATCPSVSIASPRAWERVEQPSLLAEKIGTQNNFTALALLSPSWLEQYSDAGVQEAKLQMVGSTSTWVSPSEVDTNTYTDQVQFVWETRNSIFPTDASADWSTFSLAGLPPRPNSQAVYPLIRADFLAVAADLRPAGTGSGAVKGTLWYAFMAFMGSASLKAQGVAACALPVSLTTYANLSILNLLRLLSGTPEWPVLSTSLSSQAGQLPFVVAYAPSSTYTGLGTAAPVTSTQTLTSSQVQSLATNAAQESLASMSSSLRDAEDRADLAYKVAVASLILNLLLVLAALGMAFLALKRTSGKGGTLLSAPATRYESFQNHGPPVPVSTVALSTHRV